MARGGTYIDPFSGLNASVLTSNIVSTRYAFDMTLSVYTTAGSSSTYTYQVSNASGNPHDGVLSSGNTPSTLGIPEASWSNWTDLLTNLVSGATTWDPPLGYRWARIMRTGSDASVTVDINRWERR
jgi:hypothetical protein